MVAALKSSGLEDLLVECYKDTKLFAKTFFPELFTSPFSTLHNKIFELVDSDHPKVAIAAPRGLGKTTIARTVAAKNILYRSRKFITYVSNSATSAEMQTENLKTELVSNEVTKKTFGHIRVSDLFDVSDDIRELFSKMTWVAYGNTLVLPRGSGQQIRGLNWRSNRPELLIIDDLEKKEELFNEENRIKLRKWFRSDVEKCIDFYKKDFKFIYIDTLKHEDSLLQRLIDSNEWETIVLSACDENYNSLDPNYMTTDEILAELAAHKEDGELDVFYMEYMNMPTGGENQSFKRSYFKYYSEADVQPLKEELETVVILDPAKTVNPTSAESAIVGVSLHAKTARIFVRDVISEKLLPDDQYSMTFDMADRLGAKVIGIETTSLNEFILQPLKDFMRKRINGNFYEIVELKARGGTSKKVESKASRVKALIPYYRQGTVYHNSTCCERLEQQLLSYPFSKKWDIMDAEAYMIEMLALGERGFSPQVAKEGDEWGDEDEFAELEATYDPPLSWSRSVCP